MDQTKTQSALPFPYYFWTVTGICLLGVAAAVSLSVSHYRVFTDPAYSSFCAISQAINCDTVSQSPYAILWGVPVAAWGVLGYLSFLVLLLRSRGPAAERRRVWTLLFILGFGFSTYSLALAAISIFAIGSYCLLCMALYAVNLLLLYFSWLVRRRFGSGSLFKALAEDLRYLSPRQPLNAVVLVALLGVFTTLRAAYPAYWVLTSERLPPQVSVGLTPEGRPWMGAENPVLEIFAFTDYQCFQCRKMQFHLKKLIAQYPDRIRLVHYHYPMDHEFNPIVKTPFHIGSGRLALLAIHAAAEGKFWDLHDVLYQLAGERREIDLHELASQTGMAAEGLAQAAFNPEYRKKLAADIRYGLGHSLEVTPSYVVDGKVYPGGIPPEIFKKVMGP
jgi:uncharacterized membrane protein/protein-disulfide isomerase